MSRTRFRVNPHSSCLNVKELLARSRREIGSLSDCNRTRTRSHLVYKRTLKHLAKLAHQTMKFGQLIEYNMRNIVLEKSYTKYGGETSHFFHY